jgi:hypothetical protein
MFKLFGFSAIFLALSAAASAHDPTDGPVALESDQLTAIAGRSTYQFQLVDTKSEALITEKELAISHEKKLHLIVYDPALKEFQHVHPEFVGDRWSVTLDFAVNGEYRVWAQGMLAEGSIDFNASAKLTVTGGRPAWSTPPVLGDVRIGTDGNSRATISAGALKPGQMAMLTLTFTRTDGTKPDIKPYLGAFAHVILVPEDADSLLHVHPMNGANPNEGMIHTTFPEKGDYRLWVQFLDGENLRTIPLSVSVE